MALTHIMPLTQSCHYVRAQSKARERIKLTTQKNDCQYAAPILGVFKVLYLKTN